jgi:hypothetical protein
MDISLLPKSALTLGLPSILFDEYWGGAILLAVEQQVCGVELTTHLHLMSTLKMGAVISLLLILLHGIH